MTILNIKFKNYITSTTAERILRYYIYSLIYYITILGGFLKYIQLNIISLFIPNTRINIFTLYLLFQLVVQINVNINIISDSYFVLFICTEHKQ